MTTVTLTASVGGEDVAAEASGDVPVADTAIVTLTLATDPPASLTDVEWTRDGDRWPTSPNDTSVTERVTAAGAVTRTFAAKGAYGTYAVTATPDGAPAPATARLKLTEPKAPEPPAGSTTPTATKPVEVEVGEMDPVFTYRGGIITTALVAALLVVLVAVLTSTGLPGQTTVLQAGQHASGGYAERAASIVQIVGAFGGVVLLVVGGYLAALET